MTTTLMLTWQIVTEPLLCIRHWKKNAKPKTHGPYPQNLSLGKKTDIKKNHFVTTYINTNYVKCHERKQRGTQLRLGEIVEVIFEGILKNE